MYQLMSVAILAVTAGGGVVEAEVRAIEERVFAAITERDGSALAAELTEDFVLSSPGKPDKDRDAFVQGVVSIPYRILEVHGEDVRFRLLGDVAILSGVQRARVEVAEGKVVVARTAFVDLFVYIGDAWLLSHAFGVELPETDTK